MVGVNVRVRPCSDTCIGFTTITSTALLFAKTSLSMPSSSLILVGILAPLSGIFGSLLWPRLQRRFGWTNLQVLVILVSFASLIPAYGCLGFLFEGSFKFGGLTTPGEMYGLAVVFGACIIAPTRTDTHCLAGSVYGAFQGYARAFYAELIPPKEEARWYGLYSITDKVCCERPPPCSLAYDVPSHPRLLVPSSLV